MKNDLLIKIVVFISGGIVGIFLYANWDKINLSSYSDNDKVRYSVELYEDGYAKNEGYLYKDSFYTKYHFAYYRYPVEQVTSIRIFIDGAEVESNFGRNFYKISFDTAGHLNRFMYYDQGEVKYQHNFTQSKRQSPITPIE